VTLALLHDASFLEHDTGPGHPESPDRLRAVLARLEAEPRPLERPRVPAASRADVAAVHDPRYLDALERACAAGGGHVDPDTPFSERSFEAALRAAGAAVLGAERALGGAGPSFALVRPPGHHAGPPRGSGFCLLNNVAIAARAAVRRLGARRVAIVDVDVHHGNGTQDVFVEDPSVLYVSTHAWPAYPGTGAVDETGEGAGRGTTANVPLPAGYGDAALLLAIDRVVAPLVRRYAPDLLLVSAGYDAHWTSGPFLAGIRSSVTVRGYAEAVARLRDLAGEACGGRLALALEGGYEPEALGGCVLGTLDVLGGRPVSAVSDPIGPAPWPATDAAAAVAAAARVHGLS
jgi:acetoin utilization deacetylase AcuC-like enzyme